MKRSTYLAFAVTLLTTQVCILSAAVAAKPIDGFSINTQVSYRGLEGKEMVATKNLKLSKDSKEWEPIANLKNGVTLLGRMVKVENDNIGFEYMLIDPNKQNEQIITKANINTLLGIPSQISIGDEKTNSEMVLSFTAQKTKIK